MKYIYIHGMGDQLSARKLKGEWDLALFEKEHSDTIMAYYADVIHPKTSINDYEQFKSTLVGDDVLDNTTRTFTKAFVRDVYQYLYDDEARRRIQARLVDLLDKNGEEPIVIVSHSMGTIVAYEVLSMYEMKLDIPMLVTLGCPLGIEFLQGHLRKTQGVDILSKPWCVKKWYNFADPLDVVAADKSVADEFVGTKIRDFLIKNKDELSTNGFGPHSSTGYLRHEDVRKAVKSTSLYGNFFTRPIFNLTG